MKTLLSLSFAAVAALAGCDAVTNHVAELVVANEPTIVISAGYRIDVAGRQVPIQGYEECPKFNPTMVKLFGHDLEDGKATCIVLAKERTKVPVLVALPAGGAVREDWSIIRETGKTDSGRPYARMSLRRPDGSLVVPVTATEGRS